MFSDIFDIFENIDIIDIIENHDFTDILKKPCSQGFSFICNTEFTDGLQIKAAKEARLKRCERSKNRPIRKKLPENLERKEVHVYPDGYNPEEWELLDEKEPLFTEVLVKEPAKFYVLRTYRHKALRKSDRKIITADAPVKPLAKSYASSSLLADLMVDKYVDHIPFYRQKKQFEQYLLYVKINTRQ